jgi:hypothetical protein
MPHRLALVLMLGAGCQSASLAHHPSSILQEQTTTVRLVLIDASTEQPLAGDVEISEPVVCKKAPCPPRVEWSQQSDRAGVVAVPRTHLTATALVGARRHVAREIVDSSWNPERDAWTIELIPTAVMRCESADRSWTLLVPADGHSAELLRADGRAGPFGIQRCTNEILAGTFRRCFTPRIYDAGYFTRFFSGSDGSISARLAAESRTGPKDLAELACRTLSE